MNSTLLFTVITLGFALIIFCLYKLAIKLRQLFWDMNTQLTDIDKKVQQYNFLIGQLSSEIKVTASETQNAIYLNQLNLRFPLFLGGWSIDPFLGRYLVQHITNEKPNTILELGSGASTLIIAKTLQLINTENRIHIAVDHEEKYLNISRECARINELEDQVNWLHCPLANYKEFGKLWYSELVEHLQDKKIDLLIVDGPPGPLQPHSRYPALPIIYPFLNEHCTIILDDAIREQEQEIVEKWISEYPEFSSSLCLDGHGMAILIR